MHPHDRSDAHQHPTPSRVRFPLQDGAAPDAWITASRMPEFVLTLFGLNEPVCAPADDTILNCAEKPKVVFWI